MRQRVLRSRTEKAAAGELVEGKGGREGGRHRESRGRCGEGVFINATSTPNLTAFLFNHAWSSARKERKNSKNNNSVNFSGLETKQRFDSRVKILAE